MGVFRATVDCVFPVGSGRGTNTWHVRTLGETGTTTEVAALMGLVQDFYESIAILEPTGYEWRWDGTVAQVGTPTPNLLESADPWTVVGTDSSGNWASAPSMACVSWKSLLATRSGRGRTFIGPLSRNSIDTDATLSSSQLTTLRTAAAALVSASLLDTNGAVGVWSEKDQVLRDFASSSVTDQVAVLRSRRS